MERLHEFVSQRRLKWTFAAWCSFTKDSRRIKEVLKVHISSYAQKECENSISVGTSFSGRGSMLKAGMKSAAN